LDETLLSRVEDAGLNASAPPQQRWLDGWIVRTSPGKAKRARCVNAVAPGRLRLDEKLRLCEAAYREAGLPLVLRITPFTQPASLDAELAARGLTVLDDTRVMVCRSLAPAPGAALPPAFRLSARGPAQFAEAVGLLRGSPAAQRAAHAERLALSPVPYSGWVVETEEGAVAACGQIVVEADIVGIYDLHTRPDLRGRGLATALCQHLLTYAASRGAELGYLQVEADNAPARSVYRRLAFVDGYAYHYRQAAAS
jgi:ribosomal protein S18 acetylase RimI-like enzyme